MKFAWASCAFLALASSAFSVDVQYTSNRTYVPDASATNAECKLVPDHVWEITAGCTQAYAAKSLVEAAFPSYTVSIGSAASGTVTVSNYSAYLVPGTGSSTVAAGATLAWDYTSSNNLTNYRLLQVIYTNLPYTGATSPYLDPVDRTGYSPLTPFYWNESENSTYRSGSYSMHFEDNPQRPYIGYSDTNPPSWNAAIFLCEMNFSTGALVIHDGVWWGFNGLVPASGSNPAGGSMMPGGPGNPNAVPEPSTFCLVGLLALVKRNRK